MIPGVPDPWLLLVAAALPVAGALFVLVMPSADRLALRYVGMGTSIAAGLAGLRSAWVAMGAPISLDVAGARLSLDGLSAPLLLSLAVATPIALRSGAPRIFERTQFYVVTVLFAEGLCAAALVLDAPLLRLSVAVIAAVPFFALVALFGGPQRGTTTLSAAMIWLLVDVAALAVIAWLAARAGVSAPHASVADLALAASKLPPAWKPWVFMVLAAPAFTRLAAGPFSVWLASFLDQAPVSAAILAACGAAPLGAQMLVRIAIPSCAEGLLAILPWIAGVGALSVALSGIIAIGERDLRKLLAQLLQAAGATAATTLCCLGDEAMAAGVIHVVTTGAAAGLVLAAVEAIERRYETRDAVELAGLGQSTQLLATFLIVGLLCLVGIPALGAGTTLWSAAAAVASSPGLPGAGLSGVSNLVLAIALVAGAALASAGVAAAA
ncbi:MAG TPA: proton-conducting transporter membrane subunit, partial [Myxococcota bacterium]